MSASEFGFFFFAGFGLPFTAYAVLQAIAAWRIRTLPRWLVLLPVVPMALVLALTFWWLSQDSNLWPMLLIFASPPAALYVAILLVVDRSRRGKQGSGAPVREG